MSASDKVALPVTFTTAGVVSTVTVLGQVLNDGQTNWVPSGSQAIYLATSSVQGEPVTVLDGTSYYESLGPALPDQATPVSGASGSAASASGTASAASSSGPASTAAMTTNASSGPTSGASLMPLTSSASSSASQTSSKSAAGRSAVLELGGLKGFMVGGLLAVSLLFGAVAL